jgi:hypothetical protein
MAVVKRLSLPFHSIHVHVRRCCTCAFMHKRGNIVDVWNQIMSGAEPQSHQCELHLEGCRRISAPPLAPSSSSLFDLDCFLIRLRIRLRARKINKVDLAACCSLLLLTAWMDMHLWVFNHLLSWCRASQAAGSRHALLIRYHWRLTVSAARHA